MQFNVNPSHLHDADIRVPGDKSISHRSVMFGSIATGKTEIRGFLDGEDCLSTLAAMRAMGVRADKHSETELTIHGVGLHGLKKPDVDLDLGNSGTAMRLLAGLMAGQAFSSRLVGDASLTSRPMGRVIKPLELMGASIASNAGKPPLCINENVSSRGSLHAIHYDLPVASAQVKSCVLIAGLYADGVTSVVEPAVTRDHSERMLRALGVDVVSNGPNISIAGGQTLVGGRVDVPGDLSSATFMILAALLSKDADLIIRNVGLNPTRTGVLDIFKAMGAKISIENPATLGGEPVGDIRVCASKLQGIDVDEQLVSLAIDEFPALFVAAGAAIGTTRFSGLEELRVKESDRIASMAKGLSALGIAVEETPDGAVVTGGRFRAGSAESHGDHRVAMSLAVAATVADGPVTIFDVQPVETSFPGFADLLNSVGGDVVCHDEALD